VGLTLIRKSDPARPKRDAKVAVVLAGGAISGGAFKVGGLKALNDFLVLDLTHPFMAGSFLEIDVQVGGEALDGPWEPAGPDWSSARTDTVTGIAAAEIQAENPSAVATRWAALLGLPVDATDEDAPVLNLDNAALRFVPAADGRGDGLAGIDIGVTAPADVIATAERRKLPVSDQTVTIGGVRIRLAGAAGRRVPGGRL